MRAIYSLLFVLFAIHLSGCSVTKGIKPSELATTQFLQKMQAHNYPAAYQLLSSKCKAITTAQAMSSYWVMLEKNEGKAQSWKQQGMNFYTGTGGSNVQLTYSIQCAKGTGGIQFVVVPENDKWLIQGFNVRW
jgi:hypothetical protein